MIRTIKLFKQSLPVTLFSLAVLLAILQAIPPMAAAERVYITDHGRHLFPFYKDGKTYLFGMTSGKLAGFPPTWEPIDNAANWWVINDDPKTGFTRVVIRAKMASEYRALTPFYLNNHPYIFGLHMGANEKGEVARDAVPRGKSVGANIWRINDDARGLELKLYKGKMDVGYRYVVSFQLKGKPYILGLHDHVGANIWRINEGPKGLTFDLVKYKAKMASGRNYDHLEVFYMDGHPYIFGVHIGESGSGVGANIWRVKDDPSQGLDLVLYGAKFPKNYDFISPFHVGGRPYLFAASLTPESYPTDLLELGVEIGEGLIKGDWAIYEPGKGYGVIWEIGGDPRKPSIRKISQAIKISHRYWNLITFEQGGMAYIFGIHAEKYANIWRVGDDPAKGFTLEYYGRNK
jgi:hypothetical protein